MTIQAQSYRQGEYATPAYDQTFDNVVVGAVLVFQRDVWRIPPGIVIATVALRIQRSSGDSGTLALFLSQVGADGSVLGQVDLTGVLNGVGRFTLGVPSTSSTASATITPPSGSDNVITVTSVVTGYAGNNITIAYTGSGTSNQTLAVATTVTALSSTINNVALVVTLGTDGSGVVTSTAADIATLLTADATASTYITAVAVGNGAGVVDNVAVTALSGGNDGTATWLAGNSLWYAIDVTYSDGATHRIETGTITTRAVNDDTSVITMISYARASDTGNARYDNILNRYVDATLEVFRSLQVWDQAARRATDDPLTLRLPYQRWNPSFTPEVIEGDNDVVPSNLVTVDYDRGLIRVAGDTGYKTYFVTYQFDYFGNAVLGAFLDLTLQELNLAGSANRYTTDYATVDNAPRSWDAPLTYGVLVKAFRRLAADTALWKNRLIWADGASAQQLASDMASQFSAELTDLKQNLKWGRFLAKPSDMFGVFESVGFGFFSVSGSKFRELQLNKLAAM